MVKDRGRTHSVAGFKEGAPAILEGTSGRLGRRVSTRGLHVPCDERQPCRVLDLTLTAASLSDVIGGGLLDDTLVGHVDGQGYTVYLDEQRLSKGLPGNQRAVVLLARLGHAERAWLAGLHGDALILGCNDMRDDVDIPEAVIEAARRSGLLPHRQVPPDASW